MEVKVHKAHKVQQEHKELKVQLEDRVHKEP